MRLMQIVSNVIDNAIKYTRKGGNVLVSLSQEDDRARVRVRDDGMGIPPDALASVFDLFFQAQTTIARSSGGLGIGLTLVKNLTELHGGEVSLRSDGIGRGTEVELRFPAIIGVGAAAASSSTLPRSGRPRRVLIVEDNSDARDVLADLCTLWGHEVVLAADGLEGVTAALERVPDVAFIDIGLPGIDGCEVARRVRADPRGEGIRLVALTGYGSAEQRADAAAAGFDLHITKPADPERLAEVISAGRRRSAPDGALSTAV
jgi:CheY-like chemotaxis protein